MESHFAPAGRSDPAELAHQVRTVNTDPVAEALLEAVPGLVAILNQHRQVIAVNDAFTGMLGIEDPDPVLGMRPGEIVDCVYADVGPDGCGTSELCATCGAVIAVVTSMGFNEPAERICALRVKRGEDDVDLCLRVNAAPVRIADEPFILVGLSDMTEAWTRAALERAFFHTISLELGELRALCDRLTTDRPDDRRLQTLRRASHRLAREVAVQSGFFAGDTSILQPDLVTVPVNRALDELEVLFAHSPLVGGMTLRIARDDGDRAVRADEPLLLRVLADMVTNALEASGPGDPIDVWVEAGPDGTAFKVRNRQVIDGAVVPRIFQRYFSTKDGEGRGFGTFAMKLIGERYLGGRVDFVTGLPDGTVFTLMLPG